MIPNPYPHIRAEFQATATGDLFTRAVIGWDDEGRALVSDHRGRAVPAVEEDNFVIIHEGQTPSQSRTVPGLYF